MKTLTQKQIRNLKVGDKVYHENVNAALPCTIKQREGRLGLWSDLHEDYFPGNISKWRSDKTMVKICIDNE